MLVTHTDIYPEQRHSLKNWNDHDTDGNVVMIPRFDQGYEIAPTPAPGVGRGMLGGLILVAVLNLVFGLSSAIDGWAHLGGFVGGIVLGFVLPYGNGRRRA